MKKLITVFLITISCNVFAQSSGTFKDNRDGQVYKWVRIGSQIWMAENLNYNPGRGSGQRGYEYGRIYDWDTAQKVCPNGWHLPTDDEWLELERYLGLSNSNDQNYRQYDWTGGKQLKSKTGWQPYMQNGNGIDSYGFAALPGGFYQTYTRKFMYYGTGITFWTATEADSKNAVVRELGSHYDGINRSELYKVHGAYCRCVKD